MGSISVRFATICFAALMLLALPNSADCQTRPKDPPADPSNIVGYRYDKNWWELGASIDDVELKGFRPEATDDQSVEVYNASDYAIWFGRQSIEAYITLVFVKGTLGAIIIRTRDGGEDYRYYKQYYAKRFSKCTRTEKTDVRNTWLDKDDDTVTVENQPSYYGCPTEPPASVIVYLRRHVIQPDPASSMPQWLDNVIHGIGYAGIP